MVNTFLVKMDNDCDGVSCVTYDDHYAEIARLQSRLQAMTENAERLAVLLPDAIETENEFWTEWDQWATLALAAHRKLMEGK